MASVAVATGALTCLLAASAGAATFEVTRKNDPVPGPCQANDCSLREAIRAANARAGKDTVVLPAAKGAYNLGLATTNEDEALDGDLDVTGPLVVVHPGKGRATVDGNDIDRVFEVRDNARTGFRNLVIRDGDGPPANEGGGIKASSDISLNRTNVLSNHSDQYGGGIGLVGGAGITLLRSRVANNVADNDGGGIDGDSGRTVMKRSQIVGNESASDGGGFYYFSDGADNLIADSTIAGNEGVDQGGGLFNTSSADQTLRLVDTTISGNTGETGGAIGLTGGTMRVTNATLAGNSATESGGGVHLDNGILRLNAVSVVRNQADSDDAGGEPGGGVFLAAPEGTFELENSLIALNRAADAADDCAGDEFDSLGHNLLSLDGPADDCEGFEGPGDLVRGNPKLGPLAKNGGPTKTVALKKGSPAIGKAKRSTAPSRDQRGERRDRKPDVGAFER